jgi:hypothetical protein
MPAEIAKVFNLVLDKIMMPFLIEGERIKKGDRVGVSELYNSEVWELIRNLSNYRPVVIISKNSIYSVRGAANGLGCPSFPITPTCR